MTAAFELVPKRQVNKSVIQVDHQISNLPHHCSKSRTFNLLAAKSKKAAENYIFPSFTLVNA